MTLQSNLEQAKTELTQARNILHTSQEHINYLAALKKVSTIEDEIKKQEEASRILEFEAQKSKLIELGFECRTGHSTSATNHHGRTSDDGEPYTYVVVLKCRPRLLSVSESSRDTYYNWEGREDVTGCDDKWVLAHGETEQEAWEDAIDNYLNYPSTLEEALEGVAA